MNTITSQPVEITQGESKTWSLLVTQTTSKTAQNLQGAQVYFTVKSRFENAAPLISKRTAGAGGSDTEVFIVSPQSTAVNTGRVYIYLLPEDTAKLKTGVDYVFDAWVILGSGEHRPVLRGGRLTVNPRVTVLP